MPSPLSSFQDAFAEALFAAGSATPEMAALLRQPGFAVYRNTVMKGCIDALHANFPAVARLVGEEWFRAAATEYVATHRPSDARMLLYGDRFAHFLAHFPPAAGLPYLSGVARLDRFWTEAHAAPDLPVFDPELLSTLSPEALGRSVLHPHASAHWAWFDALPVYTIWERNRTMDGGDGDGDIAWHSEGALILRPDASVQWHRLSAAECAFLAACRDSRPLAKAAQDALEVDEQADIGRLLARLLHVGAFGLASMTDDPD